MPTAPYYQDAAVTIYHGDCREIVHRLGGGCETIITDLVWPDASTTLQGGDRALLLWHEFWTLMYGRPWLPDRLAVQLGWVVS